MGAARTRNLVAVLAIALTAVLFTSLFTIAASLNASFQQENFRQAGGDGHGTIKDLTWEQVQDLRDDLLIVENWARMFLGMPTDPPFHKSHVEVSYIEPNGAPHYFCDPVAGALPQEGTSQAATDTRVLALLGVEPEIGAEFTLSFYIDINLPSPRLVTRTFTLSGWWEYDSAMTANNVLVPRSAAEEIAALSQGGADSMTGQWNLDVMFQNDRHILEDLRAVLANRGYQNDTPAGENYLNTGVNWGYSGAQFSSNMDPGTLAAVAVLLLLIVFTGYLIIYNVFQISVTNDIRFYGLLKTIGTTGRQIKRIIRQQALLLSLAGIPIGLVLGFLVGNRLAPVILDQLDYSRAPVPFSPRIFLGAAAFSLATVFLSCARPGRMAAKVSPVEAVRYTEGGKAGKRTKRRKAAGASLLEMAWANLGRSRSKTVVTVLSLTLAVVLATMTYTFAHGFDMEKYLYGQVVTDFLVGHADCFQSNGGFRSTDQAVPESVIAGIDAQGTVTESGRVYGQERAVQQFLPEEFLRQSYARFSWYDGEAIDEAVRQAERREDGMLAGTVQLYGMEELPLSKLKVLEGDLAPLADPSRNAIAAAYSTDDYNALNWTSNWAKTGDTVTLRYVTEWTYFDTETGKELSADELGARYDHGEGGCAARAKTFTEKTYTVCALVELPSALSYRYSTVGSSEMILGAEQFRQDSGMDSVMFYAFNTAEEANEAMEGFLAEYTESVQPEYDYESKQLIAAEFDGFRTMFLTLGGALSGVIGLVGVLNFVNAVLTGILTRKRELAMLQSVGMTGRQLKTMLVFEGLSYTLLALLASFVLAAGLGPVVGNGLNSVFWFFTYRLTLTPILAILPIFLVLGAVVPLLTYRSMARHTIVERLREAER